MSTAPQAPEPTSPTQPTPTIAIAVVIDERGSMEVCRDAATFATFTWPEHRRLARPGVDTIPTLISGR